jgi:hypothetical protein
MTPVRDLVQEWRVEASRLRDRYGEDHLARLCETHAAELAEAIRSHLGEELSTLRQPRKASSEGA